MDYFKKFTDQLSLRIFGTLVFEAVVVLASWWFFDGLLNLEQVLVLSGVAILILVSSLFNALALAKQVNQPVGKLAQVISYKAAPNFSDSEPDLHSLKIGRELITALAQQVYDLAAMGANTAQAVQPGAGQDFLTIFNNVSMPLIAVDEQQKIKFMNRAGREYFDLKTDPAGREFFDVANLSFSSDETYEHWLEYCRANKVTATSSWRRVRAQLPDQKGIRQFDLSASFAKGAPNGVETVLVLFDQTELYGHDDQQISFVALAVHELRTPLTIMRGYIEVFEDELGPKLEPEMKNFMYKMAASAEQLTSFVSNILNVARVEENQLFLTLREEQWEPIIRAAVADLELRARVHGRQIKLTVAPNLPTVAVDRVSIAEVINNLVENAIKYAGNSVDIEINCQLNSEGMVETAVTDHGIGIPVSIMPHLFEKFYRSHRTRGTVGGTGLGLYLSRAIMTAHGGTLKVESKEGQGSTFRFGLQQFSNLDDETKSSGQDGIMRGAHGWIKNHNVYRG